MAYEVGRGKTVTVLHPVYNLAGTATVTGEAANITAALLDPFAASSALPVTTTEIGTTGYYHAQFTPGVTGAWQLTLTNPAGTDAAVVVYVVTVVSGSTVAASSSLLLTSRARVKERLWPQDDPVTLNTAYDDFLDSLISEVSDEIHKEAGRILPEQTYTEYAGGDGGVLLHLRQGPIVSVTSVEYVEYGGTTSRTETLTTVEEASRLELGLRADDWHGLGAIYTSSGWWAGRRNYKVIYVAGYDPVPERIVRHATAHVVTEFFSRETKGLASKVVEDGQLTLLNPMQLDESLRRAIEPFKAPGIA